MRLFLPAFALLLFSAFTWAADNTIPSTAVSTELKAYYAEPTDLPYDEELQEEKQEDGWHWREFRYTSLLYGGEPIRIHAVYAAPDGADAAHKVPAILMTHGIFGAVRGGDKRYWDAVTQYVKAGYAVLFFDWYPNYAHDFKPQTPEEPRRHSTFGKLDYFTPSYRYSLPGNDWKDSLHYQVGMAAKRGISWLQARPEVDGSAIGVTGWSYGGIFSSMIAGIDDRIAAVNPCVYTARFGPKEHSYNGLRDAELQTEAGLKLWQSRFDSHTLLAQRAVPVLYTVGANDNVFVVTKAMECFAAMRGPKSLLIGPNDGHGYWALSQGILFFDSVLKKSLVRPALSDLTVRIDGAEVVASVKATGAEKPVEFFTTTAFELDPITGWTGIPAHSWKWTAMPSVATADGRYEARWPLPAMRPANPKETIYRWGEGDRYDPAVPSPVPTAEKLQGAIHVFARATGTRGAQACSQLSSPLLFADRVDDEPAIPHALPKFEAAVRVKDKAVVELTPNTAGQPAATLDLPLPLKAVGKAGYVLWNWRKEQPSTTLQTDGVATPTKSLLPPFADSVPATSFNRFNPLPGASFSARGRLTFRINGKTGVAEKADGWHGAVAPGMSADEITLQPGDAAEHRATLVIVGGLGECNVRVSLRAADGATETVQYRQLLDVDNVFQFRFAGPVVLRVEVTSWPFRRSDGQIMHHLTPIGPSALFVD
jgi:dienelactone hydrolase